MIEQKTFDDYIAQILGEIHGCDLKSDMTYKTDDCDIVQKGIQDIKSIIKNEIPELWSPMGSNPELTDGWNSYRKELLKRFEIEPTQ